MGGHARPHGPRRPKPPLFADTYRPVGLPWLYRPMAALVVLVALLQPLIYAAFIAGIAWATAAWAVHGVGLLGMGPGVPMGYGMGRARVWAALVRVILYMTPLVGGVLIVLLLLGALIPSRREPEADAYPLARVEHPLIYAYVDKLCDLMRAPRPVRIDLSAQPNASASFDGRWAWLVRRRLVLTIGAPLVAGMTRRELTGVVAHELAHFTQGLGMRSTRIVGAMNRWFERVVYRRGMIDDLVEDWRESEWALLAVGGFLVTLAIGCVRGLLMLVVAGVRLITLAMLRRMEEAADRCQTRVAGSAAVVSSHARMIELSEGFDKAMEVALHESAQGRLPEDLADLTMNILPMRPRNASGFIAGWRDRGSVWRSHPTTSKRVAAALAMNEPGVVLSDGPAAKLFPGFGPLSKAVTRHMFEQMADDLSGVRFLSTDALLQRGEHDPARAGVVAPVQPVKGEAVRPVAAEDDDIIPFAD